MSSYDQSLLKNTQVSKAERQEGYNVDLLTEREPSRPESPSARDVPSRPRTTDPERALNGSLNGKEYASIPGELPVASTGAQVPFWRTKKGLLFVAIAAIVVIGALVGGLVGGLVNKHKSSNTSSTPAGSSSKSIQSTASAPSSSASVSGIGSSPSSTVAGAGPGVGSQTISNTPGLGPGNSNFAEPTASLLTGQAK